MADVKWIKITTDMFDNRKIKHLRKLPEGNNIVLIWVMLLTMAGRCNSGGMIFLTENIPYTPKMLADELDFEENTVLLALEALDRYGMVVTDNGFFRIAGWSEHQNIEGMEKIREQNRIRQKNWYDRQKALPNVSPNVTVTHPNATDIDIEEEIDIEIEREKIDYNGIINAYNGICKSLPSVRSLSEARKKAIKARMKTYGMEDFKLLFEKAEASSFLKGKNGNNWSANFDWLIKDANMAKVLDGNYDDKPSTKFGRRTEAVPSWMSDKPVEDDLDRLERQMAQKTLANDPEIKARADALKERLGC